MTISSKILLNIRIHSQKEFILRIIKSCVYYDVGETRSLEVIERLTKKRLSVKTFYNYKKILYKNSKIYETKFNHGEWVYRDLLIKSHLLFLSEDDMAKQFQVDKLICNEFPDIPKNYRERMKNFGKNEIDNILNKFHELKNKINKEKEKESELRLIPIKATIRKEEIKCGKKGCHQCPHGPYYYAYWKEEDAKTLKKVYLGSELPEQFIHSI
ncbi:hypothetical protein [Candidatus Nitrosocosmicus sp. SS]|jgi:hypothetical protein|uniref:hypothetical protein n=1 Tax=Candidatus Nitrosocosmicus agrestis TaxID=2563600 RepID=UPI00122DCA6D|nr:hypothetical protein [Candidatus Nitrosocosmicus sp. SS]KAA2280244.1 hypothetical protein F1Z66_11620 [Candidatus Nitrosocosmicus sp. SS]KAF0869499.1 hypothetical protein E5N71_04525 [Candidatus Nitrosocosmicus sp. SS]